MADELRRQQITEQIDANMFGVFLGSGLLLFAGLICEWGPLPLLAAMLGVAVTGRIVTRPHAHPPSWIPRAPGFETEVAQDEAFLDTIPPPRWSKVRFLVIGELMLLALLSLVSSLTRPWWPARELGAVIVMLLIAFAGGGMIAMSSCWIQAYKDLIRSSQ